MARVETIEPIIPKLYSFSEIKVGALVTIYEGDFAGFFAIKVASCDYDEPILVELTGHNYWKESEMKDFGKNLELIERGSELRIVVDD